MTDMAPPNRPQSHDAATMPQTLRTYAEQLPTVLSVPNLARTLREAADEIDRLRAKLAEYDKYVAELTNGA